MKKLKTKLEKKVVLAGGVFDILHFGHIHFLNQAKKMGDHLIVIIESDKRVKKLKGNSRPFHTQKQRQEMLKSLTFVDEVIILKDEMTNKDYKDLVAKIRPAIIAITKGDPITKIKKELAESVGGKIVEINKVDTVSTSKMAKLLDLE